MLHLHGVALLELDQTQMAHVLGEVMIEPELTAGFSESLAEIGVLTRVVLGVRVPAEHEPGRWNTAQYGGPHEHAAHADARDFLESRRMGLGIGPLAGDFHRAGREGDMADGVV